MPQPYDFWSGLTHPDLGAQLMDGFNSAVLAQKQQLADQQALAQQAQLQAAQQSYLTNPTAQGAAKLTILNPQQREAIKGSWDTLTADRQREELRFTTAIRGYVAGGQADKALAAIDERLKADREAGQDTTPHQAIRDLIAADPAKARGFLNETLSVLVGPEKFGDTLKAVGGEDRADAELPSKIANTEAQTGLYGAQTAETQAKADAVPITTQSQVAVNKAQIANIGSQITERASRLDLDRDRLESDVNLRMDALRNEGLKLSGTSEKTMTDAVIASSAGRQQAARTADLATRIRTTPGSGGLAASAVSALTGITGDNSSMTKLRIEAQGVLSAEAVKRLPPGPATDKDIKQAREGLMKSNATAADLADALDAIGRLQSKLADADAARADWISANGNLGTAKYDLSVNGVRVPKGASYADYEKAQIGRADRESTGERSYLRHGR